MLKPWDKAVEEKREAEYRYLEANRYPKPTGISCPKCGEELVYPDNLIRPSCPPCRQVQCLTCGFVGYL